MQNPSQLTTLEQLLQQALMKIGRNLLAFQRIEGCLKIMTPYLTLTTCKDFTPPQLNIQRLLANKQTLGLLLQSLKDGNHSEAKEEFELYLSRVLDHRNKLVHHFLNRNDAALDSEEKCRSAIRYLDEQHEFIQPLATLMEGSLTAFSFAVNLTADSTANVTNPVNLGET